MKKKNGHSSSGSIRRWMGDIALGVLERIIGPFKGRSLRSVLAIAILTMLITTTIPLVINILREIIRERDVHTMQDQVLKLEARYKKLQTIIAGSEAYYREVHYVDRESDEKVVSDIWENGRLNYRNYFVHGNIVARDIFLYQNDKSKGKKREYFDNNTRVMIEDFSATGILLNKHHCLKNDPGNCRDYVRELRSPLPPVAYAFYR